MFGAEQVVYSGFLERETAAKWDWTITSSWFHQLHNEPREATDLGDTSHIVMLYNDMIKQNLISWLKVVTDHLLN